MKQKGTQWIGPDGLPTAYKYVPEYERRAEAIGQKLAGLAVETEALLAKQRGEFVKLCTEMLLRYKSKNNSENIKSFSFTTFDKGYRIEMDMSQPPRILYRVYEATKENPTFKDYRLVCMDFSRTGAAIPEPMDVGRAPLEDKGTEQPLPSPIEQPNLFESEEALNGPLAIRPNELVLVDYNYDKIHNVLIATFELPKSQKIDIKVKDLAVFEENIQGMIVDEGGAYDSSKDQAFRIYHIKPINRTAAEWMATAEIAKGFKVNFFTKVLTEN